MLRKALWSAGLRYRLHYNVTGRPDLAFPGRRLAIFVDGCFWHGCPLHATKPKSNRGFWKTKFQKNRARDRKVLSVLQAEGWTVHRFWEHEVREDVARVVKRIKRMMKKSFGRSAQTWSPSGQRPKLGKRRSAA
jgi:DNA mismatch endonuclease (patch repair protein)